MDEQEKNKVNAQSTDTNISCIEYARNLAACVDLYEQFSQFSRTGQINTCKTEIDDVMLCFGGKMSTSEDAKQKRFEKLLKKEKIWELKEKPGWDD